MRRANGTGSIYKMTHKPLRKPYRVVISTGQDEEGRIMRKTIGTFRTAREAQECLKNYKGNPNELTQRTITVEKCWDWMIDIKKRKGVSIKSYETAKKKIQPIFNMPITSVKLADLQAIIDTYSKKSRSTLNQIMNAFYGLYEAAEKNDVPIVKNYTKYIILPAPPTKEAIHKPYTMEELSQLWKSNTIIAKWQLIYIYTGLRPVELRNMKIDNINLKDRYMVGGSKTKAGRNRIIPIAEHIATILSNFYSQAKFKRVDTLGEIMPLDTLYRKELQKEYNHLPHDTRHTFATLADDYKLDQFIVKRIMGHTLAGNITQQVYTHKDAESLIAAVNLLPGPEEIKKVVQELGNREKTAT